MLYFLTVLFLAATALLMFGQWLWLERRHNRRHRELRGKYYRYKSRAEELLDSSKLQIESLQHQLTGARLEARRNEPQFPKTIVQTARPKATATSDSLLMMFNEDSRPMGYESAFGNSRAIR